ncbi:MAG: PilZ domain-containing protein [Clostridia bacterium]|nr:PilZ domain-containing protein [Clostridia bacterium]
MAINTGEIVSITHYSDSSPFKSIVIQANKDFLWVKITKNFAILNFLEGDPIVLGFEEESQIRICSCTISSINAKQSTIELKLDSIKFDINKRSYERFPVSFYADVKGENTSTRYTATVKNMSYGGLMICSKGEFSVDQSLEIDIYIDKKVMFSKTDVIWKAQNGNNFEYGLKITMMDPSNQQQIKKSLEILKKEQEEFLRELKNF